MISFMLLIHISLATLSIAYALGVVLITRKRDFNAASLRVRKMWLAATAAVITGFGLTYASKSSITSACTSSLVLLSFISLAHYYQRNAVKKWLSGSQA